MNKPATFKAADVARAIKAISGQGLPIGAIEFAPDGTIRVMTTPEGSTPSPTKAEPRL